MGDDGVVHIIADTGVMHKTLAGMDLSRAQLLSDVSTFWLTRSRSIPSSVECLFVTILWQNCSCLDRKIRC